ncbi:hypothetical protein QOT17_025538, partial [Balamuthia mandrillaris]
FLIALQKKKKKHNTTSTTMQVVNGSDATGTEPRGMVQILDHFSQLPSKALERIWEDEEGFSYLEKYRDVYDKDPDFNDCVHK